MSTSSRKAFTLVELIAVIVVIMILTTIGIWNIVQLRQDAQSVATSDALATVQRMQELANMEGLSQTNTDRYSPNYGAASRPGQHGKREF